MALTVKIVEAEGQLSDLLEQVEAGEDIIISRGDVPIARLSQIPQKQPLTALIESIRSQRALRQTVSREEIRVWRDEGRP